MCVCVCVFMCVVVCNVWLFYGSICTCIYNVLYRLYCVILFRLFIFIPICFVCTGVRTAVTE
jgi:hypothetical protein